MKSALKIALIQTRVGENVEENLDKTARLIAQGAKKGPQTVKAAVTYFYCSKREGWCRKSTTDLEVPVTVP